MIIFAQHVLDAGCGYFEGSSKRIQRQKAVCSWKDENSRESFSVYLPQAQVLLPGKELTISLLYEWRRCTAVAKQNTHITQIGDNEEVVYFEAETSDLRDRWLMAFRKGINIRTLSILPIMKEYNHEFITVAEDNGNKMLSHYHPGAYEVHKNRWTCCNNTQRLCQGCFPIKCKRLAHNMNLHHTYGYAT